MSPALKKVLWRGLQIILTILIFYFLGGQLINNWSMVKAHEWHINYFYISLGVIAVLVAFFVFSSVWKLIIRSLNKDVGYVKSFKIAYLSNLGRYIPGKIWQMFGMIYLAKKEGITEEESITSFGLSQLFSIPSGLLAGLILLGLQPGGFAKYADVPFFNIGVVTVGIAMLALSLAVVFLPRITEKLLNGFYRMLRRRPVTLTLNKSLAGAIYGGYFLAWCLYGFAFWVFLKGITTESVLIFPMAGAFIIAYQIGYLALFAPGGVGPREAMMTIMLAPYFGTAVATAIALASRLWLIGAEAASALISLKIK
jgi:glycosyltransferase 2 family protein